MGVVTDIINGEEQGAFFRAPAWHGLGTVFTEEITDYRKMLEVSGLAGWNIRLVPLQEAAPGLVWPKDAEGRPIDQAIVRTNPVTKAAEVLGTASRKYGVVQNEDALAFLQSLKDGARWETAGPMHGGRLVFASLAFERETVLDPSGVADIVRQYLLLAMGHDGSRKLEGGKTAVRVVCQNTLDMAFQGIQSKFGIRHTMKVSEQLETQARIWRDAEVYFDAFEVEAQALYAAKMTKASYVKAVGLILPTPEADKKGAQAKYDAKLEQFMTNWSKPANAGIRGTKWGGLNAITETLQWNRRLRGSDDDGEPTPEARENFSAAGAGFDRLAFAARQKALEVVKSI